MNLLITCQRNTEEKAMQEITQILNDFGDSNPNAGKTRFSGIIKIETDLNLIELVDKLKRKIENEPWELRYCSRIIPIQKTCKTDLEIIKQNIIDLIPSIMPNQTYRISIEKRDSKLIRNDIISNIANLLISNVSLEKPDWEIIIQILGDQTAISVMPKNSILNISKLKRLD